MPYLRPKRSRLTRSWKSLRKERRRSNRRRNNFERGRSRPRNSKLDSHTTAAVGC
jgi:hypothetical protein